MVEQTYVLGAALVSLCFGILFFGLFLQRQEIRTLSQTLSDTLSMLNISQKKGEAGENMTYKISESLVEAGILEKKVRLPDNKELDFAALLGSSENGERIYVPVDSKVNKAPAKVIEEISKYTGLQFGSGFRTTTFAVIGYPEDEEQKYMEKRTLAREHSVFFVPMSQLPAYLNFIRWYHDNIAPLESAGYRIGQVLILFKSHYAQIEKQFNEVDQKMNNLRKSLKFSPVGENLRQAIASAELANPGSNIQGPTSPTVVEVEADEVDPAAGGNENPNYVLSDDTPLSKFKPKGLGKKRIHLEAQGYQNVGEMRGLSLGDLVAYGYTDKMAETIHAALNEVVEVIEEADVQDTGPQNDAAVSPDETS